MTTEKAIKILNEIGQIIVGDCTKKALEMAIKALERQIPKKVIFEDDGDSLLCPNCGLELMGSLSDPDHDPYYCFECGQALDWGESND